MEAGRGIKKVLQSRPTLEGAGVHLKRVFGFQHVPDFDPFLLLDDFGSDNPDEYMAGFPWHPHRGIETITYMLQGKVEHGDSMGNQGVIETGDVQWMTAGSGIVHQEMPLGSEDGRMRGFQLWANLPAADKMMDPRYRDVTAAQIPVVDLEGNISVRVIAGRVEDVQGPVQDVVIEPEYLDIAVPPNTTFTHLIPSGHTVFAYVFEGAGYFEPERDPFAFEVEGQRYFDLDRECLIGTGNLVHYEDGDRVIITAGADGVRFLLVAGKPINEPVAWYGPIVMNTQEELRIAFEEYRRGSFLKHA